TAGEPLAPSEGALFAEAACVDSRKLLRAALVLYGAARDAEPHLAEAARLLSLAGTPRDPSSAVPEAVPLMTAAVAAAEGAHSSTAALEAFAAIVAATAATQRLAAPVVPYDPPLDPAAPLATALADLALALSAPPEALAAPAPAVPGAPNPEVARAVALGLVPADAVSTASALPADLQRALARIVYAYLDAYRGILGAVEDADPAAAATLRAAILAGAIDPRAPLGPDTDPKIPGIDRAAALRGAQTILAATARGSLTIEKWGLVYAHLPPAARAATPAALSDPRLGLAGLAGRGLGAQDYLLGAARAEGLAVEPPTYEYAFVRGGLVDEVVALRAGLGRPVGADEEARLLASALALPENVEQAAAHVLHAQNAATRLRASLPVWTEADEEALRSRRAVAEAALRHEPTTPADVEVLRSYFELVGKKEARAIAAYESDLLVAGAVDAALRHIAENGFGEQGSDAFRTQAGPAVALRRPLFGSLTDLLSHVSPFRTARAQVSTPDTCGSNAKLDVDPGSPGEPEVSIDPPDAVVCEDLLLGQLTAACTLAPYSLVTSSTGDATNDVLFKDDLALVLVTGCGASTLDSAWNGGNQAFVLDLGGDDTYRNNAGGVTGGNIFQQVFCENFPLPCAAGPIAVHIDLGGTDRYDATTADGRPRMFSQAGVTGGAGFGTFGGFGLLYDVAGDDTYVAGPFSQGSAYGTLSHALFLDRRGNDRHTIRAGGTAFDSNAGGQGFAAGGQVDFASFHSVAIFADQDGDDTYAVPVHGQGAFATIGGNPDDGTDDQNGLAMFLEGAGDDRYNEECGGSCQGAAYQPLPDNGLPEIEIGTKIGPGSITIVPDLRIDDEFLAQLSMAFLVDGGGTDRYNSDSPLRGDDRAWISGLLGAGLDLSAANSDGAGDPIPDVVERTIGSDPRDPESGLDEALDDCPTGPDADRWPGRIERQLGTDPCDPASYPAGIPAVLPAPGVVANGGGKILDLSLRTAVDADAAGFRTSTGPIIGDFTMGLVAVGDVGASRFDRPYLLSVDLGGSDRYTRTALPGANVPFRITEGASELDGAFGVLPSVAIDVSGSDVHERPVLAAPGPGGQGAGYGLLGLGLLVDLGGDDQYAGSIDSQGAAVGVGAVGLHLDLSGTDTYVGGTDSQGSARPIDPRVRISEPQGSSTVASEPRLGNGFGILVNLGGNDDYTSATQGRADDGVAVFLDVAGDDRYRRPAANRLPPSDLHTYQGRGTRGLSVFGDLQGNDGYSFFAT
ncbi:MAG: hypothetical protein ACT4PT_08130, partial [Methanobacteriota archaeon]